MLEISRASGRLRQENTRLNSFSANQPKVWKYFQFSVEGMRVEREEGEEEGEAQHCTIAYTYVVLGWDSSSSVL